MKYIEKVILENFQSHKFTSVEFDRGLNIIVGASDSGKTAILRAIKWALYNDPAGDYFIREGATEASVSIFFSDKTSIKRYRSRSKNTYFVYDKDGGEEKYEGFGLQVPEEVIDTTGIEKILLDKDTSKAINISDQLEGAFLLSEKSSTKANSIGYLVGVDLIDDALSNTLRDVRNLKSDEKKYEREITDLQEELKEYAYIKETKKKIGLMKNIRDSIDSKSKRMEKLKSLLEEKTRLEKNKKILEDQMEKLENLEKIDLHLKDLQIKHTRYRSLKRTMELYHRLIEDKKDSKNIVKSLANLEKIDSNIKDMDKLGVQMGELSRLKIRRENNIKEISTSKEISDALSKIGMVPEKISKIDRNIGEVKSLNRLAEVKKRVDESLYTGKNYLVKLQGLEKSQEGARLLERKLRALDRLNQINSIYRDNRERRNKADEFLKENREKINSLSQDYKKLLLDSAVCPLCYSEIDRERADYIIKQVK